MASLCSADTTTVELAWGQCWDFAPKRGWGAKPEPPVKTTATTKPASSASWWPSQEACSKEAPTWTGTPALARRPWEHPASAAAAVSATSCINVAFMEDSDSDSSDDEDNDCDRGYAALMAGLALTGHAPSSVGGMTKSTRSPTSSTPTARSSASPKSVPSPRSASTPQSSSPRRSPNSPVDTPAAATPAPRQILKLEECLPLTPGRADKSLLVEASALVLAQAAPRVAAPVGPPPGLERSAPEAASCGGESTTEPLLPSTLTLSRGESLKLVPPQCEYRGSVKMISEEHGYSFIACPEVRAVYQRDVYLSKALAPAGISVGDNLLFSMGLSPMGRPMVTKVSIIV